MRRKYEASLKNDSVWANTATPKRSQKKLETRGTLDDVMERAYQTDPADLVHYMMFFKKSKDSKEDLI